MTNDDFQIKVDKRGEPERDQNERVCLDESRESLVRLSAKESSGTGRRWSWYESRLGGGLYDVTYGGERNDGFPSKRTKLGRFRFAALRCAAPGCGPGTSRSHLPSNSGEYEIQSSNRADQCGKGTSLGRSCISIPTANRCEWRDKAWLLAACSLSAASAYYVLCRRKRGALSPTIEYL